MTVPIDNLLHRSDVEYILLDSDLHVSALSGRAARFAEAPSSVRVGDDVRLVLPELVGAELELQDIVQGRRASWAIRGVRRWGSDPPLFVTVTVERYRGDGRGSGALVVMLEDVTDWMNEVQRKAQTLHDAQVLMHAMMASKAYVENIIDAMADVLIVTSPGGIISAVNRAALSLTEYSSPELIGRPITLLLPDETADHAGEGGVRFANTELRCVTRSGAAIPMSFSRAPLETGANVVDGVVYLGRDLRERKEAEAKISTLETKNLSLQEALRGDHEFGDIVGSSSVMRAFMRDVGKVAVTDATVLISGETGTGKELVARAIHRQGARKDNLLVNVNCAALPPGLIQSELFGHEKGAFTGAIQRRVGRFELADGGTVFLDEVGELPPAAQATLLRVLQEHEFERVGGTQCVSVDVRVIAATNRDLAEEVKAGRFREDLLFRLNVFPLAVPPLRDRTDDIPELVEHFMRLFERRAKKRALTVSNGAMQALRQYGWPGNVRELANVIQRAMIVCEGAALEESDLGLVEVLHNEDGRTARFDEIAREHILRVLEESGGIIEGPRGAATRLGIKPATLRSRLKKLGISRTGGGFGHCMDGN